MKTLSVIILCCVNLLWTSISLAARSSASESRVEIPVHFEKGDSGRPYLEVTVGSSGPLRVGIDTGAGGLRIWSSNLRSNDFEKIGIEKSVMYGQGETGLAGEIALATVKIGNFALPGRTRFHLVTAHACRDNVSKRCDKLPEESRRGFAGTIGLSNLNHEQIQNKAKKANAVINPLIEQGPFVYILRIPDAKFPGGLIINPSAAEKARFAKVKLSGNGQKIPMCINRYCFDGGLDTGAGHNKISYQNAKELKAIGLPLDGEHIASGTKVPIQFGGHKGFTYVFQAGKGIETYSVKNSGKSVGLLGINTFHYLDVLYDFEAGIIGFAPKQ